MRITKTTIVDAKKFWKNFDGLTEDSCWEYRQHLTKGGYGRIWVYPKMIYAHRVAWILAHGTIPKGMCICHKCDNPPCCNPKHLFLGTPKDNADDKILKGRQGDNRPRYGASHPLAKLTKEDVADIRRSYVPGVPGKRSETSIKGLAAKYGVAPSLIDRIIKGKSWPEDKI